MSEVPKLERFNKKKQVPRNDQFLFILYKKMSFSGSPKGTPHDRCRRTRRRMARERRGAGSSLVSMETPY